MPELSEAKGMDINMINKEILKEESMLLPIEYDEGSCEDAICDRLSKFEVLLKNYDIDNELIDAIASFRHNLKEMYKKYYLGHQNKAYQAFKNALLKVNGMNGVMAVLPKESLYRARKNEGNRDYKNNEMFHIKYELRGKVQTQRFSFPGLPCLYLGGSSYVCWQELNRPQFDQFQVATIRQRDERKNYKVIDLCIHPLTYYNELIQYENDGNSEHDFLDIRKYLQWWPIMAACSIVVKNERDPFKPEYIFPQFMLQYLLEEIDDKDCIGIKYISIKAGKVSKKQYESDYRTYTNYVLPIRTSDATANGFCEFLEKEFSVVRNYSGRELQVLTDSIRESGIEWRELEDEKKKHPLDEAKLFGTNDIPYLYSKSIFRRIETVLENKNMDKYNDNGKLIVVPISSEEIACLFDK